MTYVMVIGAEQKLLRSSSLVLASIFSHDWASDRSIRYVALWASSVILTRCVIASESSSRRQTPRLCFRCHTKWRATRAPSN